MAGFALVGSLSMLAGMVDAIGFIAAGDFVSFMSGNTTRLAIAIGDGRFDDAARLALILCVFVAGNTIGVVLVRTAHARIWPLLLGVCALLAASARLETGGLAMSGLVPAILAMGAMNAAVETVAGHPVGLTYVTGALSRFGKGLGRLLTGSRDRGFLVHVVPWLGMLTGAVGGALLQIHAHEIALDAGAALAAALCLVTWLMPRAWTMAYLGADR
ncbi:YoaK family protein [Fulvimarina sp. 2208YS6-2-32]|uniref:YoaK family protein n=1 Tax=Fulvimarina uroteuthidis TaxID=3098149 RepID=A0ABU5I6T8_9HYPH|nr:YoaK family protein [Fulvimarina sp. 2208YS6-2-32]MDY8111107.1 YoaK family protein [Fulvimarina sp. 2208YS6-2-32]